MKSQLLVGYMLLGAAISLGSIACGTPKTPAELESGLDSPDPKVRRNSADGLRSGDQVPAEALPKLFAAIDKEQDQEAYGAELITLGASGSADAKPYICKNIGGGKGGDVRMSRWANHALTAWLRHNPNANGCTGISTVPEVPVNAAPAATPTSDSRSM
jgi:hypothetical protein